MFTGLIESVGQVAEVKRMAEGFRLRLATPMARELGPGDSVAVNGVCLTVVSASPDELHTDISPETARVSALGSLTRGAFVNLERPLRADARLGGHFVQGHIDATGTIEDIRQEGEHFWLTVGFPPLLAPYIVRKGSVALDGISLTVAGVDAGRLDVQIIPYTWSHTNLHAARVRDPVNIECDILGKYVVRAIELMGLRSKRRPKTVTH